MFRKTVDSLRKSNPYSEVYLQILALKITVPVPIHLPIKIKPVFKYCPVKFQIIVDFLIHESDYLKLISHRNNL
jgi:hypothetical protein